ncbi:glycoside hydrolase family 108 protein [Deinococcus kurensis]|uniref:glycoside hydrolase family 108 protein n=1 Tax=Deinococcus kurensis TaxID=2662757 RepID=UPI0012D333E9|nr:glycosyl hydrolase 108 family protein [Deinococcus kurensis]
MTTDFEKAYEFTARWEGGYVNHPADKGGPTNLGVTQAVWESWCRERGLPVKPMKLLTPADVLPLYQARYWPAASGLPWPLSGVAYDIAVNHGPGNLRLMLGSVPGTGTPAERAARLIDAREQFFRNIVKARPSQEVFLKGWLRRVAAQRTWLAEQVARPPVPRVFLRDMAGKNVEWDGKPTIYNGTRLTQYPDGALQLERE